MSITVAVGWAFLLISVFAGVIWALSELEKWVDKTDEVE